MPRFYSKILDLIFLAGLCLLFWGPTNQKFFRGDSFGLAIFIWLSTILFFWIRKQKKISWNVGFHLLLVLLLSNFVFFKMAEYDPLQLLPEKTAIKFFLLSWDLVLVYVFTKLDARSFFRLGSVIAILPLFSLTNFMAYTSIPLGISVLMLYKYADEKKPTFSHSSLLLFGIFFLLALRDWQTDFSLNRGLLLGLSFLLFHFLRKWTTGERNLILVFFLLAFVASGLAIVSKIAFDPNFMWFEYHEEIALIPVSLVGSSCLLVIGSLLYLLQFKEKHLYPFFSLTIVLAVGFLLLSYSRISLVSGFLLAFLFGLVFVSKKTRIKVLLFSAFSIVLAFLILQFSQKSFLSSETLHVRFVIWKWHFLTTFQSSPLFGFGLEPERFLPFAKKPDFLDGRELYFLRDYLDHFKTFPLAHSLYFQIISATGFMGLVFFFYFVTRFFWRNRSAWNEGGTSMYVLVVLLVWAIHELLDFNSLEIANLFPILFFFSYFPKKELGMGREIPLVFSRLVFVLFLLFCFVCFLRFQYVESKISLHSKSVTASSFYEFLPKDNGPNVTKDRTEVYPFNSEDLSIRLFGDRLFFLRLNLLPRQEQIPLLPSCFESAKRVDLCAWHLHSFYLHLDKNATTTKFARYLLKLHDPLKVYSREF